MKVKDTGDYILIAREVGDSEETFKEAFETGLTTLMVGKESKRVNGIKIWKTKKVLDVKNKN